MNLKNILRILEGLAVLRYYPSGNDSALEQLVRLVGAMCQNESQVRWLVDRMTSGIYAEWPGPQEMRACYCSRFTPKDGLFSCSTVYPDGLPLACGASRQLSAPEVLALPEGHSTSADVTMDRMVNVVSGAMKAKSAIMGGPATPAEIAAAPEWLKRIEGYDD